MIITRLNGGLGNQMFQYAVGRQLAQTHNTNLLLDLSGYLSDTSRKYELDIFQIQASIASSDILKQVNFSHFNLIKSGLHTLLQNRSSFRYVKEKSFNFNKKILYLPDNVYLDGYWQSEKYFKNIFNIIRDEYTIKEKPDEINDRYLSEINNVDSVSIHIRRGDYITNPIANQILGGCSLDYYHSAVDIIAKNVKNPYFFIFSDDNKWVKDNFKVDFPAKILSHNNNLKNYEDFRLMSQCKHNIIANSSFSWWAAWLNTNSHKIIIAPKQWFRDKTINAKDLLPESWITV